MDIQRMDSLYVRGLPLERNKSNRFGGRSTSMGRSKSLRKAITTGNVIKLGTIKRIIDIVILRNQMEMRILFPKRKIPPK